MVDPNNTDEDERQALDREIARIDEQIAKQLNAVLHHPDFQRLEAAWRGVSVLLDEVDRFEDGGEQGRVRVRILQLTKEELRSDFRKPDFKYSELYRKIYTGAYDTLGADPFGVILGDYEFTDEDDILLAGIARLASSALCPFLSGIAPQFFALRSFRDLETIERLDEFVSSLSEGRKWARLRALEEARFLGLVMPRMLLRPPHESDGSVEGILAFREDVSKADGSDFLWGNAAFALGAVIIRAFCECGWFADIRGVRRGEEGGGLVPRTCVASFETDKVGLIPKPATDATITSDMERGLDEMGFIAMSRLKNTERAAFGSVPSVQKPTRRGDLEADNSAKLSAMLPYILCVSRFAHYLKRQAQEYMGTTVEPEEVERRLQDWISGSHGYTSDAPCADRPLKKAKVHVQRAPGIGRLHISAELQPHFQLDAVQVSLSLIAQAPGPGVAPRAGDGSVGLGTLDKAPQGRSDG